MLVYVPGRLHIIMEGYSKYYIYIYIHKTRVNCIKSHRARCLFILRLWGETHTHTRERERKSRAPLYIHTQCGLIFTHTHRCILYDIIR